jgi:hypothetical protein
MIPFPKLDVTPPVTNIYLAILFSTTKLIGGRTKVTKNEV